jgi:hypothetical protein
MSWFWYWVVITGLPAGYLAAIYGSTADFDVSFMRRVGVFVGTFFLIGIFMAFGLFILSLIFDLGKGAANWWNSQPDATGSSNGDNDVPPYFFLIPMFMMLGFLIRGNDR